MRGQIWFIVFLLLFFSIKVFAQEPLLPSNVMEGGKGLMMGRSGAEDAVFGNMAFAFSEGDSSKWTFQLAGINYYYFEDLSGGRASVSYRKGNLVYGLGVESFGGHYFNRSELIVGLASKIGKMAIGGQGLLHQWSGEEMETINAFSLQMGGKVNYFKDWELAFLLWRLTPISLNRYTNFNLPSGLFFNVNKPVFNKFEAGVEMGVMENRGVLLSTGFKAKLTPKFILSLGYSWLPGAVCFSVGYYPGKWKGAIGGFFFPKLGPAYFVQGAGKG